MSNGVKYSFSHKRHGTTETSFSLRDFFSGCKQLRNCWTMCSQLLYFVASVFNLILFTLNRQCISLFFNLILYIQVLFNGGNFNDLWEQSKKVCFTNTKFNFIKQLPEMLYKKGFLNISQYSRENTYVGIYFLKKIMEHKLSICKIFQKTCVLL